MITCKLFFFIIYKCWIVSAQEVTTTEIQEDVTTPVPYEGTTTTLPDVPTELPGVTNGLSINLGKIEPNVGARGFPFSITVDNGSAPEIHSIPPVTIRIKQVLEVSTGQDEERYNWTFTGGGEDNLLTASVDFNSTGYLILECLTKGNASMWTHDGLMVTPYTRNYTRGLTRIEINSGKKTEVQIRGEFRTTLVLGTGRSIPERDSGNFTCVETLESSDQEKNDIASSSVYIYVPEEQKESSPCEVSPCGLNTICEVRHGNRSCNCLAGYVGNPIRGCRLECSLNSDCVEGRVCVQNKCVDNCIGACGENSYCLDAPTRNIPICNCLHGYEGNPYLGCFKMRNNTQGTFRFERPTEEPPMDLCNLCGENADCVSTANKSLVCRCRRNLRGDPYSECRRDLNNNVTSVSPCGTFPCGDNAYCQEKYGRAICHCKDNFHGDPWVKCHAECLRREHCKITEYCIQFKCKGACEGHCGVGARCRVENHQPTCFCPIGFTGDPHDKCVKEEN